jgi:hypothetical protein
VRVASKATRPLYAHVFNLGLRGKITLLTASIEPGGVRLTPAAPELVLGEANHGTLDGLPLHWPPGLPRETFPRLDEIVVIMTSAPAVLRVLETLERATDSFLVQRLSYSLHPRDAAIAGLAFQIDDDLAVEHLRARSPEICDLHRLP